jgi:sulfate transport system ATP-binding protein
VAEIDGALVRPHDVTLFEDPEEGAREAIVDRLVRVGHEVRAELTFADGSPFTAHVTRDEAEMLELRAGQIVWVRAERPRTFA